MKQLYPWNRFWCRSEGSYFLGDEGFLSDPDGSYGESRQPNVLTTEEINQVLCLALLGDPGLGKTTTTPIFEALGRESGEVIAVNLGAVSDVDQLRNRLFGDTFNEWVQSDGILTIVLDSLDECLIHHRTVPAMLIDELDRGYPLDRLRLRISCRGTVWPPFLSERLRDLWGDKDFVKAELLPLRKRDVEAAATIEKLPAADFVNEVCKRGMVPFAIRPNSLKMLFDAFRRGEGRLDRDQIEMFSDYCHSLCVEDPASSRSLLAPSLPGDGDEILSVARRIAAVTIFGQHPSVFVGNNHESIDPTHDVHADDLVGGVERTQQVDVSVDGEQLNRCLTSGLFTPLMDERRLWSHWTYPEFLAADFVKQRQLTPRQIEKLIFSSEEITGEMGRVVPQLAETAAWIAMMDRRLLGRVIRFDPQVLLRSQVVTADYESKRQLVDALLCAAESDRFTSRLVRPGDYHVLDHPGLSDQLVPWIEDASRNLESRRVALNIVEGAATEKCEDVVRAVLFDTTESSLLRRKALDAWLTLVPNERRTDLRLLLDDLESDEDDELRGKLLEILWPIHLSSEEMFRYITIPKNEKLLGIYAMFLWKSLLERLPDTDLPVAIKWLQDQPLRDDPIRRFEQLETGILERAVLMCEQAPVFEALASLACYWVFNEELASRRDFHQFVSGPIRNRPEIRFRLLDRLVSFAATNAIVASEKWEIRSLFHPSELDGVLDGFESATTDGELVSWANLANFGIYHADISTKNRFLTLREDNTIFRSASAETCDAIDMQSDHAAKLKRVYYEDQEREQRLEIDDERKVKHPPVRELTERYLDKFDEGDLDAWWQAQRQMILRVDSDEYDFSLEYVSDLTSLESWSSFDEPLIERCLDAAEQWLTDGEPDNDTWLRTTEFHRPTAAGFRSMRLLRKLAPERLDALSLSVWEKWTPCAATFVDWRNQDEPEYLEVMQLCYEKAPDVFIDAVLQKVGQQDEQQDSISGLYCLRRLWDEQLTTAMVDRLRRQPLLKVKSIIDILKAIAAQRGSAVYDLLKEMLSTGELWGNEINCHAGALLISHFGERGWRDVFPILEQHSEEARSIVELLADVYDGELSPDDNNPVTQQLSAGSLADFYLWLSAEYPHDEDDQVEGCHGVSTRESVQFLRDRVFSRLRDLGTPESVREFQRIRDELPHLTWMNHAVSSAEEVARQKSWQSLPTDEIILLHREFTDADRSYRDFEITVTGQSGALTIIAKGFDGAEALEEYAGPELDVVFESAPKSFQLRQLSAAAGEIAAESYSVKRVGTLIGKRILQGSVRQLFEKSLNQIDEDGLRLRLRLAPELTQYPWESVVYDERHLGIDSRFPIVRQPIVPVETADLPEVPTLRVLVVASNPADLPTLNIAGELDALQSNLADSIADGRVKFTTLNRQPGISTRQTLSESNLDEFDVFHFIGHGDFDTDRAEGVLYFEADDGTMEYCTAHQLADILKASSTIRFAFLNACRSGAGVGRATFAEELVRSGVLAVVTHRRPVRDDIATLFSGSFYRAIAVENLPIDLAFVRARQAIYSALKKPDEEADWVDPILYSRARNMRMLNDD